MLTLVQCQKRYRKENKADNDIVLKSYLEVENKLWLHCHFFFCAQTAKVIRATTTHKCEPNTVFIGLSPMKQAIWHDRIRHGNCCFGADVHGCRCIWLRFWLVKEMKMEGEGREMAKWEGNYSLQSVCYAWCITAAAHQGFAVMRSAFVQSAFVLVENKDTCAHTHMHKDMSARLGTLTQLQMQKKNIQATHTHTH